MSDHDDYRAHLIGDENGRIVAKSANNFYWMLKGHPAMRGIWVIRDGAVWLSAMPPWGNADTWASRTDTDNDYFQALMWLERLGLKPSRAATKEAIRAVAHDNC